MLRSSSAQRWWLTKPRPNSQHLQSLSRKIRKNNKSQPRFNNLLDEWTGKLGVGPPTFIIRPINFQQPAPGFLFMFPAGDANQQQVYDQGIYEPYLSYHLAQDLKVCCSRGGHFLDVGSYFGWYALVMASIGCNVDAFEAVPWYQSLAEYTKQDLNVASISDKIKLHPGAVLAKSAGERRTMVIPGPTRVTLNMNSTNGIIDESATDGEINEDCGTGVHCYDVITTNIDKELKLAQSKKQEHNSCGMRVKVDGLEASIVEGGAEYLQNYRPKIVVLELNMQLQKMLGGDTTEGSNSRLLASFLSLHYTPYLLFWDTIKSYNWNAIQSSMLTMRYTGGLDQLMGDCGAECVVYFVRDT